MTAPKQQWFVVQTQPNSERRAVANLNRQGFEVYLPQYLKRRSHAGKVDLVPAPLFPRYLFVALDLMAQQWRVIRSTLGVVELIRQGDRPVPLASDIIGSLRARQDDRGLIQLDRPSFQPGDKIRVAGGAFSEHLGVFEGMSDRERVAVLLDLLGRKVRVIMNIGVIEAV
ncbi:transcription termination/antitermination protein NusG [Bradyrhizobium guangdongense]